MKRCAGLLVIFATALLLAVCAVAQYRPQKPGSSLIELCDPTLAGIPPTTTTLVKDSFTDTNGSNITAHTMDVGSG